MGLDEHSGVEHGVDIGVVHVLLLVVLFAGLQQGGLVEHRLVMEVLVGREREIG